MRQDLRLYSGDQALTLAQVFHNFKTLLIGFPGGKICTEQHIPGYAQAAAEIKAAGIDKIVAVTVAAPQEVQQWAAQQGLDKSGLVQVLSDRNGSFIRLLGLEQPAGPQGPPCQRFAAVVDNGILLRLKVEQSPAELKVTDINSMLKTFADAYA